MIVRQTLQDVVLHVASQKAMHVRKIINHSTGEACNERAAELSDEILFKQPESSHLGDCPICCLPLPFDLNFGQICCGKIICVGCDHANKMREEEASLDPSCPICRESLTFTTYELEKFMMKRIEANDPFVIRHEGIEKDVKGDYKTAFEYFTKAAELGNVDAHYQLAVLYRDGHGVEKDKQNEIHHLELAAIGGHPTARYDLGCEEWDNNDNARAVKHWIIAATQGNDQSIRFMMEMSKEGYVSKDDLAAALRAHQAAVDAAKSPQREAAEEYKRAAELRDEILFKQPEITHLGDCPICCLPLQLEAEKLTAYHCCSQTVCDGCTHANMVREVEMKLASRCPFCREPAPSTVDEVDKQRMKRLEANDPVAMYEEGFEQDVKGDYKSAFGYFTKSAELGNADAHYRLSLLYHKGHGVEKDIGMEIHHMEEAAISGHPHARHNLGWYEWNNGNFERAVQHLIIAATQGNDQSIKSLMNAFKCGMISKEELAAALRAHQAAVDATKRPQREAADILSK